MRATVGLSAALLAALPAALMTVALWDRTTLAGLSTRWAATFLSFLVALLGWSLVTGRRAGSIRSVPAALLPAASTAGAALAAVYLSEGIHHAFVHEPVIKGLALPVIGALALGVPVWTRALASVRQAPGGVAERLPVLLPAIRDALAPQRGSIAFTSLAAVGALQALSYTAVTTDDLIRYWAIADGLLTSAGYPATTGTPGAAGFYLVELPVYPVLAALSFALAGHRFLALHLPLIAANVVLPLAFYVLARAAGAGRLAAVWLSLAVVSVPYYQVYALGASQPEPLLALELTLLLWLVLRRTQSPRDAASSRGRHEWILAGVLAAAAVLTRPEGVLYVGPLALGLAWHFRAALRRTLFGWWRARRRMPTEPASGSSTDIRHAPNGNLVLAGVVCAAPILSFSAFLYAQFGIVWPAGWTNVAGPQFIVPNLRLVIEQVLPRYAEAAGVPAPPASGPFLALGTLALTLAGLARVWSRYPALRFVPVAAGLNLVVIFSSPSHLTPDLFSPSTFFRHISVLFPWLIPAWAQLLRTWAQPSGQPSGRGRSDEGRTSQDEHRRTNDQREVAVGTRGNQSRGRRPGAGSHGRRRRWTRAGIAVTAAGFLLAEIAVLGAATARDQAQQANVFTSDVYVLITDLWQAPDGLPVLQFVRGDGLGIRVDPAFDYGAFRGQLFAAVRSYDLHANDAGRAYVLASAVVALAALGALVLGNGLRGDAANATP
ncbi:MAG: glycosyltransferase family 39 protein [Chloroflexi bacterium]|nr:glycosyltransferase family 39 protein [Chloroflexota bacterium]